MTPQNQRFSAVRFARRVFPLYSLCIFERKLPLEPNFPRRASRAAYFLCISFVCSAPAAPLGKQKKELQSRAPVAALLGGAKEKVQSSAPGAAIPGGAKQIVQSNAPGPAIPGRAKRKCNKLLRSVSLANQKESAIN